MAYNNQTPPTVYVCNDDEGHPFWCDTEDLKLPGFLYYPNFITEEEEQQILELIRANDWKGGIGRRTQHYGYTYYHTKHDLLELQPETQPEETEPLDSLQFFLDRIAHFFPNDHPPTQCLVNEYMGNRGISSHVDNPNCFGDVVVGLSLCNPVYMTFQEDKPSTNTPKEAKIFLDRRSLMIMRDDVRFAWKHSITAMKRIYVPETEQCIHRKGEYCRISLTFREIKIEGTKQVKTTGK